MALTISRSHFFVLAAVSKLNSILFMIAIQTEPPFRGQHELHCILSDPAKSFEHLTLYRFNVNNYESLW